MTLSAVSLL